MEMSNSFKVGDKVIFKGGKFYLKKGKILDMTTFTAIVDCGEDGVIQDRMINMELLNESVETKPKETRVSHYQHSSGVQAWDICRDLDFNCGSAVKYIDRHGKKVEAGSDAQKMAVKDLNKAMDMLYDEITNILRGECKYKLK